MTPDASDPSNTCLPVRSLIIDIDRSISDHNAILVEIQINSKFKTVFKRNIYGYIDKETIQFSLDLSPPFITPNSHIAIIP